ncbi:MAG: extracellular solute-binding protein [Turicibacter sp.]|nr:extracellular solute-binding protein [Turicibacter sp.]
MKRIFGVLVLCLFFVACGGDDAPAAGGTADGERPFEGRTLTLGIWGGNEAETAGIEAVRAEFEAMTGANIEWRLYTEYNVQIQADFVAQAAPDAFYVEVGMAEFFASLGVLEPLDPTFFEANAFYQNVLDAFTFDGTIYAIPKDQSSLARYVNTSLLSQVGLTLADIPDAVEDYLEFLPHLQLLLDDHFGPGVVIAASGVLEPARLLHWMNRDVSPFTPDGRSNLSDPAVVQHLEFVADLFNTGAMQTPAQMGRGWNGEAFATESIVIMEEGNWVYGFLRDEFPDVEFEIIDMPTYRGVRSSMLFTVGWGIYSLSPNQDLAAEWIRFKTGLDGMYTWTSIAGPLPTRGDVSARMAPALSDGLNVHISQIPLGTPWVMGMFTSVINDAFMNFMQPAIDGTMSVQSAMQQADDQANMQIDFAN